MASAWHTHVPHVQLQLDISLKLGERVVVLPTCERCEWCEWCEWCERERVFGLQNSYVRFIVEMDTGPGSGHYHIYKLLVRQVGG